MKCPDPKEFECLEELNEAVDKYWDWIDFKKDEMFVDDPYTEPTNEQRIALKEWFEKEIAPMNICKHYRGSLMVKITYVCMTCQSEEMTNDQIIEHLVGHHKLNPAELRGTSKLVMCMDGKNFHRIATEIEISGVRISKVKDS